MKRIATMQTTTALSSTDSLMASPNIMYSQPSNKDERSVSLAEDCRRCIKALVRVYGYVKFNELCFSLIPDIGQTRPIIFTLTAYNLYVAATERKNIGTATINTLGVISSYLLTEGNIIAQLANLIKESILEYIDESYLKQLLIKNNHSESYLTVILSLAAIIASYWIKDAPFPQRKLFQIPAFITKLGFQVSSYWNQLNWIAQSATGIGNHNPHLRIGCYGSRCSEKPDWSLPIYKKEVMHNSGSSPLPPNSVKNVPAPLLFSDMFCYPNINQLEITKKIPPISNAAASGTNNDVTLPLMVSSATATAVAISTQQSTLRNKAFITVSVAAVSTTLIVSGKMIRDRFFSERSENKVATVNAAFTAGRKIIRSAFSLEHSENNLALPEAQSLALTVPESDLLCRNRLIGYLHLSVPLVPNEINDQELAKAILKLIKKDDKYQSDIAHIALYATGLYGESHDEYIQPNASHMLVGDLLSRLQFGMSIEEYLLEKFSANRLITLENFHKSINNWSFSPAEPELTTIYNERYIFPLLPGYYPELYNEDPKNYHDVLMGSPTWFLIYLGAQAKRKNLPKSQEATPSDIIILGAAVLKMLLLNALPEGSEPIIERGIKFAGLFLRHDWTTENMPPLPQVWNVVYDALKKQLTTTQYFSVEIGNALAAFNEAAKKPWDSRDWLEKMLLIHYCGSDDPELYELSVVEERKKVTIDDFKKSQKNYWCFNKNLAYKIPSPAYYQQKLIKNLTAAMKRLDKALLNGTFSSNDFFNHELPYDNYAFINNATLTIIKPKILLITHDTKVRSYRNHIVTEEYEPNKIYTFFNAKVENETRLYAIKRDFQSYQLSQIIITSNIIQNIKPFFDMWPTGVVGYFNVSLSDSQDSIGVAKTFSLSEFIEELAQQKHVSYHNKVVKKAADASKQSVGSILLDFTLGTIIPFYDCVKAVESGETANAIFSCGIDIVFTLIPTLQKSYEISNQILQELRTEMMANEANILQFISGKQSILMRYLQFRKNILNPKNYFIDRNNVLKKEVLKLILDLKDPGIIPIVRVVKILTKTGKTLLSGNRLQIGHFLSESWHPLTEAALRIVTFVDSAKSSIELINAAHEDFCYDDESLADCALLIRSGQNIYNLLTLQNNLIFVGKTGEATHNGHQIYAMLSDDKRTGIFTKFACHGSKAEKCRLQPWLPPEIYASPVHATAVTGRRDGGKLIKLNEMSNISRLIYYPNHQSKLLQDGFSVPKICEVLDINGTLNIFIPSENMIRPLYRGDLLLTELRSPKTLSLMVSKDNTTQLFIELSHQITDKNIFTNKKYIITNHDCQTSWGWIYDKINNRIITKIEDNCFILHTEHIKNQFRIDPDDTTSASFLVGWSSLTNNLTLTAPYIKKSSPHAGISLVNFISKHENNCSGININELPVLLSNGAVTYDGKVWIKLKEQFYRLGSWHKGFYPFFCSNSETVAAWLHYDLFTSSFEVVYEGESGDNINKTSVSTPFEKLINQIFPDNNLINTIDLSELRNADNLKLRLYQAALLKHLHPVDRMTSISLPVAQLQSWTLPPDVTFLHDNFPVMAVWLTWQLRIASLKPHVLPYPMSRVEQIPLEKASIINATKWALIDDRYGRAEAILLKNEPSHSNMLSTNSSSLLYYTHYTFDGVKIFPENEMIQWIPDIKYAQSPTVTQFMYQKHLLPELKTDLNKTKMWGIHPRYELFKLLDINDKIEYVTVSPNGYWLALIDNSKLLSLFPLGDSQYIVNDYTAIAAYKTFKIPENLAPEKFSLCIISDEGHFYYPDKKTWHSISDENTLWEPSPNFIPLFISPDQRFLGFSHEYRSDIVLYDQLKEMSVLLQRPHISDHREMISAVAFSPLNALIALVSGDNDIYIYDLINANAGAHVDPISSAELALIDYPRSIREESIIMHFDGIFKHLTVIHGKEEQSEEKVLNNRNLVCSRYNIFPRKGLFMFYE